MQKKDFAERTKLFLEYIKNGMIALMLEGKGRDFQQYIETAVIGDVKGIRLLRGDGFIIGSFNRAEVGSYIPAERFENIKTQMSENHVRFRLLEIPRMGEVLNPLLFLCGMICHARDVMVKGRN